MAGSIRFDWNKPNIGALALRSEGVKNLVAQVTAEKASQLQTEVGEENVSSFVGGRTRARGYVRRLGGDAMIDEVVDGRLARILRG